MFRRCSLALITVVFPMMLLAQGQQTLQSTYLRAFLFPDLENPSVQVGGDFASADAEIAIHVLRDNQSGEIVKAFVNFSVEYFIDEPQDLRAMHIHRGRWFENGPIVVGSNMEPVNNARFGVISTQVEETDPDVLAEIERILGDPEAYYLNLQSASNPSGLMRGQLASIELLNLSHIHFHEHHNEFHLHSHAAQAAEHDANTQTAVEEHEASIQSAMAEIKVLVRRIAFALNVLRRGE